MVFDLVSVTNQTIGILGVTLATFSFQDALYLNSFPGTYDYSLDNHGAYNESSFIFADACLQADGTQNCSASCSNSGTIFENLYTLHNCMVYPTVADQYAAGNLTDQAVALIERRHINSSTTNLPNYSETPAMTTKIQSCLVSYCASLPGCQASYPKESPAEAGSNDTNYDSDGYISPFDTKSGYDLNIDGEILSQLICKNLPTSMSSVNSDIGGIGVRYNEMMAQTVEKPR